MPPRIAKFAAYGAFGAVLFFVALFALVGYAALPPHTGGIDATQATVTWISLGLVVLALIAVHVVIARALLDVAEGTPRGL
jgi:TRAP-type C4-dicarboxylate transport system permease small subunit